jgi:hypothetical protein
MRTWNPNGREKERGEGRGKFLSFLFFSTIFNSTLKKKI